MLITKKLSTSQNSGYKNYIGDIKMAKEEKIEVEGKVVEIIKGGDPIVELPNGHTVKAYVSGKMRVNMIRILPGDTVTIELSPYDLTRGRIIWNKK